VRKILREKSLLVGLHHDVRSKDPGLIIIIPYVALRLYKARSGRRVTHGAPNGQSGSFTHDGRICLTIVHANRLVTGNELLILELAHVEFEIGDLFPGTPTALTG